MPRVAGIIIGNEILTGKFQDENGPFLIRRLRALGADLGRLVTLTDDLDEIAEEVRRCSETFDAVFTSGGVGPTHDDVTLEGVARAFGVEVEPRQELLALLEAWGLPATPANHRMATVPQGTEILSSGTRGFPVLRVRNVYVLPGVPGLFREKFEAVASRVTGRAVATARVYTSERETEMAGRLATVAAAHPDVAIGSYPRWGRSDYSVIVTLESRDEAALAGAFEAVCAAVRVVSAEGPGA